MSAQNPTPDDLRTIADNLKSEGQNSRAEVLYNAAAELQALREVVEAARRLEIEVKPTPNGNKVLVIWDGSRFEDLAAALAKLDAKEG
jgi:hypothetical protein